jgi:hypothetical protein
VDAAASPRGISELAPVRARGSNPDRIEALWTEAMARASVNGAWDYTDDLVDVLLALAAVAAGVTEVADRRAALDRLRRRAEHAVQDRE